MSQKSPLDLGKRERQIVEVLYQLGEASVADVREQLPDPPSYSAVRAMLNLLVEKGHLTYREEGRRYIYRPARPKTRVRKSALQKLVQTFFAGEPVDAMAALMDGTAGKLNRDDVARLKKMIDDAERNLNEGETP